MTNGNTGVTKQTNPQQQEEKKSIVQIQSEIFAADNKIASFRNRPMLFTRSPYPHFIPLRRERFDAIAYPLLGAVSRSRMGDIFAYVSNTAIDISSNDHLVLFGIDPEYQADGDMQDFYHESGKTRVWDTRKLEFVDNENPAEAIWRSPYGPIASDEPIPFIMSLAGGDKGKYDDIMQSLAPMVMDKKPDGVIWWIGDGANGKSTLMDALYRVFPGQLSSITVKRLVDGRDTPSLNGTLANVVKESSETRIDDSEIYKSIGTHENFRVHKFHSQDDIEIRGNLHHIMSGNSIPLFGDKGWSARRRTFIVPFSQRFESDPDFERKTFTPEFFGRLIAEMCKYAIILREQGYKYKWSADTIGAKMDYDIDTNNAEEYAKELIISGVVAFDGFTPVRQDYENFCSDHGYVPLGLVNFRKALLQSGFERTSVRDDNGKEVKNIYRLRTIDGKAALQKYSLGRPGLYTLPGFKVEIPKPKIPRFNQQPGETKPEKDEPKKSILKGKW